MMKWEKRLTLWVSGLFCLSLAGFLLQGSGILSGIVKKVAVAFLLVCSGPAMAQQPPADRAYQQTVTELVQAWIGARKAWIEAQDQIAIKDAKIAELEAKLPRQEPVKGPSGVGAGIAGAPTIVAPADKPSDHQP